MIKTSDFLGVIRGNYDYLFFIVADKYWHRVSYDKPNGSWNHVLESVFARGIGNRGALVSSFSEDVEKNYAQVLSKPWPDEVRELLDDLSNPILLVIATDFGIFDPNQDRFILINFNKVMKHQGDVEAVIQVLREIERVVRAGEDLFQWWEQRASKDRSLLNRLVNATEAKPGIWGFSFDLKKFFKLG